MRFKGLGLGFGFVLLSAVALVAQYAPFYVLDGYGGVHAGGGAPVVTPAPTYFGWNIARDLVHIPVAQNDTNHGDGLLVLDGFGGIHKGGKLSTVGVTPSPYFGWDIARAIDFRRIDPQAYGGAPGSYFDTDSTSYIQAIGESMNMVLPDAGYVVVTINAWVGNIDAGAHGSPNGVYANVETGIGVNSTTTADSNSEHVTYLGDERGIPGQYPSELISTTRLFYFPSSGTQRFYFLVRRYMGTGTIRIINPTITCMYFNKRWNSWSLSSSAEALESDLALAPSVGKSNIAATGNR